LNYQFTALIRGIQAWQSLEEKRTQTMEIEEANTEIGETAEKWRKALSKVVEAVVVLQVTATRDFDTESASVSNATGFIVDKQRGIILTNRHVVQTGPVVAEATFLNREEIPVYPLYRDPVHDFGFFRFDPAALKFMKCEEIPLAPEAAAVGLEVRVVGNDSGEKLSILAGTLARLDRNAPQYDGDGYNDFNTFYMQAASGTKGGSSGSPVINCHGQAVGLNAGGKTYTSSAFYLPLDRVVRALKILQKCNSTAVDIPRGTLQMTLVHKGFDKARRLGLQAETEQFLRQAFPAETGILVIKSVVPGGPAHKMHLEPGDLLVRVNGELVTQFLKLETVLDDYVGKTIDLEFERCGDPVKVILEVQDLQSITPDYFLEVSGAVIHPLSYQQARNFFFNCGLVYVAEPGYMLSRAGVPSHAIIKNLATKEITGVEDFISVFSKLPRGSRVPLEFVTHEDGHPTKSALVTVDRHEWYAEPQLYTRDDASGFWKKKPASSITSLPASLSVFHDETDTVVQPQVSLGGQFVSVEGDSSKALESIPPLVDSALDKLMNVSVVEQIIEPTLVMVEVDIPLICMIDGVHVQHFSGTGVVVYHSKTMGIVAVDRNTVPISISDVMLAFAAYPMEIPGEVVFLHPVHNFALVAYDPVALGPAGAAAVQAAVLLPEPALHRGDAVYLVGLNHRLQATSRKSFVTDPVAVLNIDQFTHPRYRAMNMEVIELDTNFGNKFTGVLADEKGRVQALWGRFSMQWKSSNGSTNDYKVVQGIPIYAVNEVLHKIINGTEGPPLLINGIKMSIPLVRILEIELCSTTLSKARSFGLSEKWITELLQKDPVRRQVLQVKRCFAGSRAECMLKQGDMLLAIDEKPITTFRDVENACQVLDESKEKEGNLRVKIFRQGLELDLLVGTDVRNGFGTTHMVNWCGSLLQEPHSAVRSLGFLPKEGHGVYVARRLFGSPLHRYGVSARQWIVEVNGKATPDLQTFVNVIKELENGVFVRVKTMKLNGKPSVLTLKQDLHYWPTWELKFDPNTATWSQRTIRALNDPF